MKINKNNSNTQFENAPEYNGVARLVDYTELADYEYDGKTTQKFRMIFEIDALTSKGKRHTVSSKPLLPSLHEKSNLTKVITSAFGLNVADLADPFDTDSLLGKSCNIIIEQKTEGDRTFSNITYFGKAKTPATWDSTYVKLADRKNAPQSEDAKFEALLSKAAKKK